MRLKHAVLCPICVVMLLLSSNASAQITSEERTILARIDIPKTLASIRTMSEDVVKNDSGVGAGSAVSGSADEKKLGDYVEQQLRALGLQTRQEMFPVRQYDYGAVVLTAAGKRLEAVSWHSGGGTWGTRDGVVYARGNEGTDRHRVRALLVDVGDGFAADYAKVGTVTGKVVLVKSRAPGTQVIEAAEHGAVALLMYDPDRREDALRTGLMGYNDQVPTAAIKRIDAVSLQRALAQGSVEVTLENRIDVRDGFSSNVIATVIGTEFPDEWITVSGHHDRWFKGAADNCSGVASMLELARLLTSGGYRPRRSMLFISFGSEESGIDVTSSSFLAGSHAFVKQHPEITRRLVLGVNMDITGVAGGLPGDGRGSYTTTPDSVPFATAVVHDLENGMTVAPTTGTGTDAWNLSAVGGGTITWLNNVSGGRWLSTIYHTNFDVFTPDAFPNLENNLRAELLSLVRADRAVALPIDFGAIASWTKSALTADTTRAPGVSFADAEAALDRFVAAWERVARGRGSIRTTAQARAYNAWLLRTRKDLLPWLFVRGGAGAGGGGGAVLRTSPLAIQLERFASARAAAETGNAAAAVAAIQELAGDADRVTRATYAQERLASYTSGDWSVEFQQRPVPLPMEMYDIYERLRRGDDPKKEAPVLRALEDASRRQLADSLFLISGKLSEAAKALDNTPRQ